MFLQAVIETVTEYPNVGYSCVVGALVVLWRLEQSRCNEDRKKLWEALADNKTMVLTVLSTLGQGALPPDDKKHPR